MKSTKSLSVPNKKSSSPLSTSTFSAEKVFSSLWRKLKISSSSVSGSGNTAVLGPSHLPNRDSVDYYLKDDNNNRNNNSEEINNSNYSHRRQTPHHQNEDVFFPTTNFEFIQKMTPNQRWYRRQFIPQQHVSSPPPLVSSTDDIIAVIQHTAHSALHEYRQKQLLLLSSTTSTSTSFSKKDHTPDKIKNEINDAALSSKALLLKSATQVVDILVGTVDTPVFVSPERYLEEIAPELPEVVHCAVVRDLLVTRREQAWELLLLASRVEAKTSGRSMLSSSSSAALVSSPKNDDKQLDLHHHEEGTSSLNFEDLLEQKLIKSVKYHQDVVHQQQQQQLEPSSSSRTLQQSSDEQEEEERLLLQSIFHSCKKDLAPIVTKHALHDASILLEEYENFSHQQMLSNKVRRENALFENNNNNETNFENNNNKNVAVEASYWLNERLSSIGFLQEEQQQEEIDAELTSLLKMAKIAIRNQLIQNFVQNKNDLAAIRCWSHWILDEIINNSSSDNNNNNNINNNNQIVRAFENYQNQVFPCHSTVISVATAFCRIGMLEKGLSILRYQWRFAELQRALRNSNNSSSKNDDENEQNDAVYSSHEVMKKSFETTACEMLLIHTPELVQHQPLSTLKLALDLLENNSNSRRHHAHHHRFLEIIATKIEELFHSTRVSQENLSSLANRTLQLIEKSKSNNNNNNNNEINTMLPSTYFSLLCASKKWERALAMVTEAQNNNQEEKLFFKKLDNSGNKSIEEQLALAGAPWNPTIRQLLEKKKSSLSSIELSIELIKCSLAQNNLDAAYKLLMKVKRKNPEEFAELNLEKLCDHPLFLKELASSVGDEMKYDFSIETLVQEGGQFEKAMKMALEHERVSSRTPIDVDDEKKNCSTNNYLLYVRDAILNDGKSGKKKNDNFNNVLLLVTQNAHHHNFDSSSSSSTTDLLELWSNHHKQTNPDAERDPLKKYLLHDNNSSLSSGGLFLHQDKKSLTDLLNDGLSSSFGNGEETNNNNNNISSRLVDFLLKEQLMNKNQGRSNDINDHHHNNNLLLLLPASHSNTELLLKLTQRVRHLLATDPTLMFEQKFARNKKLFKMLIGFQNINNDNLKQQHQLHNNSKNHSAIVLFEPREESMMPVAPWEPPIEFVDDERILDDENHNNNNNNTTNNNNNNNFTGFDSFDKMMSMIITSSSSLKSSETVSSLVDLNFVAQKINSRTWKNASVAEVEKFFKEWNTHLTTIVHNLQKKQKNKNNTSSGSSVILLTSKIGTIFSVNNMIGMCHFLLIRQYWSALAGCLSFTRDDLKLSLPLELMTLIIESCSFSSSSSSSSSAAHEGKNAVFAEVMKFHQHNQEQTTSRSKSDQSSSSSSSLVTARATAQRLAARALHRSSHEDALAALDFAVWCGEQQQQRQQNHHRKSSSTFPTNDDDKTSIFKNSSSSIHIKKRGLKSSFSASSQPALAQSALWRLAHFCSSSSNNNNDNNNNTTPGEQTQTQKEVRNELWNLLSKYPQPVVVPWPLLEKLSETLLLRCDNDDASSSMNNTEITAFVENTGLRLMTVDRRKLLMRSNKREQRERKKGRILATTSKYHLLNSVLSMTTTNHTHTNTDYQLKVGLNLMDQVVNSDFCFNSSSRTSNNLVNRIFRRFLKNCVTEHDLELVLSSGVVSRLLLSSSSKNLQANIASLISSMNEQKQKQSDKTILSFDHDSNTKKSSSTTRKLSAIQDEDVSATSNNQQDTLDDFLFDTKKKGSSAVEAEKIVTHQKEEIAEADKALLFKRSSFSSNSLIIEYESILVLGETVVRFFYNEPEKLEIALRFLEDDEFLSASKISILNQKTRFELIADLKRRIPGKEEEGELLSILNQNRFRWVKY